MSSNICKDYLYDTSYSSGCAGYFASYVAPTEIGYLEQADGIEANNPHYYKFQRCWRVMRDSVEGQDAIREHAEVMDYLQIPAGVACEGEENGYRTNYVKKGTARFHYINKAHYIEIVPRILDEVEGRIFSKPYKYEGPDDLTPILDSLDSEGLTFQQYIRWCVREVFSVSRFGVLVDWDGERQRPIFKRYIAESIVNWKINKRGELRLVVLEDEVDEEDQLFSHNKVKRRISFTVEKDSEGQDFVVQRTWLDLSKGTDSAPEFIESDAPIALTRNGFSIAKIPFIFFGGIKPTAPMLKPLAASALDYFDAHASYRNALWWACNEQPYFKFETGADKDPGFVGVNMEAEEGEIEILYGSSTPIILKDGDLKFAGVRGVGLDHMYRRLKDIKAEMTGMGARSFNAQTASNIKVQTERMQQRAEGSVIGAISSSISLGIKHALEIAMEWSSIEGSVLFELNTDYTDDFDIKLIGQIIDAMDANIMAPIEVFEFLRDNSEIHPSTRSYEEHLNNLRLGRIDSGRLPDLFNDDDAGAGEADVAPSMSMASGFEGVDD